MRNKDGVDPSSITSLYIGRSQTEYPRAFTDWVAQTKTQAIEFNAGEFRKADTRFACGAAKLDLLTVNATMNPQTGELGSSTNADSAIVRLSYKGNSIIFPGDAEGKTERSALENARNNNLDISGTSLLLASHHGARTETSNSPAWLNAVSPNAMLFSARVASSYHHPQCEVINRAAPLVAPVDSSFDVECGLGNAEISSLAVSSRILGTNENGHILARMTSGGTKIFCQKMTPACDEQLSDAELPR
ncbi:hypothetical protein GCM10011396_23370 [Undibacterium terreum]|uniref:ComEC family competence protein n=1 Tax=Undibacterium terreum TaxID=1224302 RepID=A0A916UKB4_9BURK|nr:hypothetical protein GCM10011396_23370 [Undibacterium terreum]